MQHEVFVDVVVVTDDKVLRVLPHFNVAPVLPTVIGSLLTRP